MNASNGKDTKHLLWIGSSIIICTAVAYFLFMENQGRCKQISLDVDKRCEAINRMVQYRYEDLRDHIQVNNELLKEVRQDIKKLSQKKN